MTVEKTVPSLKRRQFLVAAAATTFAVPAASSQVAFNDKNFQEGRTLMNKSIDKPSIVFIHRRKVTKVGAVQTGKDGKPLPSYRRAMHPGQPKYRLTIQDGEFIVYFENERYGEKTSGWFTVPVIPGVYVSLVYDGHDDMCRVVNLRNAQFTGTHSVETGQTLMIGRVLVTSREVIASLNGVHTDIDSVKNVERLPEESSEAAIMRVSDEGRFLIKRLEERNALLSHIDLTDYVLYLEAQVDLLTKIVIDAGFAKEGIAKELLTFADHNASWRYDKPDLIKSLFAEKLRMRQAQQAVRLSMQRGDRK